MKCYFTMAVAMVAARFMQMSADNIIDMIAMWNSFMSAFRSVCMCFVVTGTGMVRRASALVLTRFDKVVLVYMVSMHIM
jgi:hypothetical protein